MTDPEALSAWIVDLGISDRMSGLERAETSRNTLLWAGRRVFLPATTFSVGHMIFGGLLARAQGLHQGVVGALQTDNPHAGFALLRAYAENAASILYLTDKPSELDRFWRDFDGPGIKIGRITNHAKTRFRGFPQVYNQLSKYTHPHATAVFASSRPAGDNGFAWQSAPAFKADGDYMVACAWLVELSEATAHLLVAFAEARGWDIQPI